MYTNEINQYFCSDPRLGYTSLARSRRILPAALRRGVMVIDRQASSAPAILSLQQALQGKALPTI
jgi:hypothetical protein